MYRPVTVALAVMAILIVGLSVLLIFNKESARLPNSLVNRRLAECSTAGMVLDLQEGSIKVSKKGPIVHLLEGANGSTLEFHDSQNYRTLMEVLRTLEDGSTQIIFSLDPRDAPISEYWNLRYQAAVRTVINNSDSRCIDP